MVSFTKHRLFGEGAAGSPVDGKRDYVCDRRIARRSAAFSREHSPSVPKIWPVPVIFPRCTARRSRRSTAAEFRSDPTRLRRDRQTGAEHERADVLDASAPEWNRHNHRRAIEVLRNATASGSVAAAASAGRPFGDCATAQTIKGVRKNPHENELPDCNKTDLFRDRFRCVLKTAVFPRGYMV